ncbi:unnamed protein product, partial [Sphacelaria rigidula]
MASTPSLPFPCCFVFVLTTLQMLSPLPPSPSEPCTHDLLSGTLRLTPLFNTTVSLVIFSVRATYPAPPRSVLRCCANAQDMKLLSLLSASIPTSTQVSRGSNVAMYKSVNMYTALSAP